jgi:N-acetylneuraminate synthase
MTKIIAEIGINHGGNLAKALRLIDLSKDSNCWAVKFQYRPDKNFFSENDEMASTLIKAELSRSNLKENWIDELINYAKEKNIKIGFSFFRKKDITSFFSINREIDFIKIPSAEFRNIQLIKEAKKTHLPVFVSYGGGNEQEIFKSIEDSHFDENDCVMHCISNYPTILGNQQLDFLKKLKEKNICKVGYSSHDKEWEVNLLSLFYGIDYIERHICEDKNDLGLDISTSSDFDEFLKLSDFIKNFNDILSAKERKANQGEVINVRNLGSGLYFDKDYRAGTNVSINRLDELSPATGLRVSEIKDIKKFALHLDAKKGDPLTINHINGLESLDSDLYEFRKRHNISIPVRVHDFYNLKERFGNGPFEFHLSFKEVDFLSKNFSDIKKNISKDDNFSIHLPDYISQDHLIDPFSNNKEVKDKSLKLIENCINLSKSISDITDKKTLVLGSFSQRNADKDSFYSEFKNFIHNIESSDQVQLLAQWLPKKAWYFGGTVILDQFCEPDDEDYLKKYKIPLCLDIAHLILSNNYFKKDWYESYLNLYEITEHIHLSDAVGTDGEGVEFGTGSLKNIKELLNFEKIKVLEVWEGHHDFGQKFKEGLNFLRNEYTKK